MPGNYLDRFRQPCLDVHLHRSVSMVGVNERHINGLIRKASGRHDRRQFNYFAITKLRRVGVVGPPDIVGLLL